ncbi:hypothetical protein A7D23_02985 [Dehalobacter sp. TeCB1]|nr:hypothetical protein A7D23_02985 [Dehalobacter sp. TeCB1]
MGYPTDDNPVFTFVDQLVCALADLGVKCSVISPQSITKSITRGVKLNPTVWSKKTKNNHIIDIYQPKFISFSEIKVFGFELGQVLYDFFFERAVKKAYKTMKEKPKLLYGHFWNCGFVAAAIGCQEKLPVYVACGEGELIIRESFLRRKRRLLECINGVISVSTENKAESIKLELADEEKIIVIPNAVDQSKFYKMDKNEARVSLGFSEDDFIIAYTGWFSQRKGSRRVSEAIKKLDNVKSVFIGSEEDSPTPKYTPDCEGILFCGRLPHQDIVKYLNCADVFVLPTLAEGCCNSIVEAMACGLPIISSDLPCNDDILDENNSIRIDPQSVDEIADAIRFLKDSPDKCHKMAEASLQLASQLTIDKRARKIFDYIMQNK